MSEKRQMTDYIKYEVEVHSCGTNYWYLNGKLHREDGPAIEYGDGTKKWYLNDTLHREDGPAIEFNDGTKKWFSNGELHREDGPAIEWGGGIMSWFLKGKRHRDGSKHWYLNGKPLTHEEFKIEGESE